VQDAGAQPVPLGVPAQAQAFLSVSAHFPTDFPTVTQFGLGKPKSPPKLWSPKPEVGGSSPPCPLAHRSTPPTARAGAARSGTCSRLLVASVSAESQRPVVNRGQAAEGKGREHEPEVA
jgi:hypothetical protein